MTARVMLALLCWAMTAPAQAPVKRVRYTPGCQSCIQLTKVLTFPKPGDSSLVGTSPVRDSRGRLYMGSFDRTSVLVYDSVAQLIMTLGRRGAGPGEFSGVGGLVLAIGKGDTLFAFQTGRANVFDPELKFSRAFRLPTSNIIRVRPLSNGTFVISGTIRTPPNIGYVYHVLGPDGRIIRSFGDASLNTLAGPGEGKSEWGPTSIFTISPDEKAIWIASGYHVREGRLDGSPGRAFDVTDSPWLPDRREITIQGRRGGRGTTVTLFGGVTDVARMTQDGLLWIGAGRESKPGPDAKDWVYAIEVFDPTAGTVVASIKTPGFLDFIAKDLATSASRDSDDVLTFTIWRIVYTPPRRNP